ncbi:RNA-guided endonuclease InsQ/TnpB family protein [Nocardia sp. NPDC060256]|uniref:RNA-guided endonuclease InsQ/TnpB family protein n=1 Tax=unclassified Nocardia TaxID=2637762 RepID=UPI0036690797
MDEVVRYSFRLRPGRSAESASLAEWGRCRFLWNEAVHQQKSGNMPTYGQALTQSFTVKGRGRPVFKARKRSRVSLEYTRRGFSISDGRLVLAKGISIPVVWSRELPSDASSVRIIRDSLGHWYVSFVVRRAVETAAMAAGGIGIDWGVHTTATTTHATFDLPYRGYRARCAAELARAQRKMARRRGKPGPQSRGYQRAAHQVAKLHAKAARQTRHDLRVWAKAVADQHELIAVEDFEPKFLAKSTMARKAADAAIGAAKREHLELAERTFRCHRCGYTDCRDRNAARVILAVAERGHARVDDVRQSDHLLRAAGSVAVRA